MKRIILIINTLLLLVSVCAQNTKNIDNTENLKKADSLVFNILDNLKRYEQNPYYTIQVKKQNCRVLIRINDLPFAWDFTEDEVEDSRHLPINGMIESSGVQHLMAELYPLSTEQSISNEASVNIKVFYAPDRKTPMSDLKPVIELNLPDSLGSQHLSTYQKSKGFQTDIPFDSKVTLKKAKVVNKAPKIATKIKGSFQADLPFNSKEMLKKARDLSKIPDIENKIKKKYQYINSLIEKGDAYTYIKESKETFRRFWEQCYVTKEDIANTLISDNDFFNLTLLGRQMADIKDYEITFYHDNRVVVLRDRHTKSLLNTMYYWNTEDGMKKGEGKGFSRLFVALYMPEGSDELKIW